YTKDVYQMLMDSIDASDTYVDWFAHLMMTLFREEGIVLMDSAHPSLREIETPFLKKMIVDNATLNEHVLKQKQRVEQAGYGTSIDVNDNSAHLFYHLDGERVLLERDETGYFRGKDNECVLTTEELLTIADEHPEQLSNNVVTRPLMQEQMLPTLAFVGGPGE